MKRIIELSDDDFQLLIGALGLAAGEVCGRNRPLFLAIMRLANTVNRNNPGWAPYEVPEDETSHA